MIKFSRKSISIKNQGVDQKTPVNELIYKPSPVGEGGPPYALRMVVDEE